jgi:hypothetical protein
VIALRVLATIASLGILAAVAHTTIGATGGYGWDTNAPLTIALAVGVAIGAPVTSLCRPDLAGACRQDLARFWPASSSADRVGHSVG